MKKYWTSPAPPSSNPGFSYNLDDESSISTVRLGIHGMTFCGHHPQCNAILAARQSSNETHKPFLFSRCPYADLDGADSHDAHSEACCAGNGCMRDNAAFLKDADSRCWFETALLLLRRTREQILTRCADTTVPVFCLYTMPALSLAHSLSALSPLYTLSASSHRHIA